MATEKTCFKCGQQKPLLEFYRHPKMADGLLGKCKECTRKDVTDNRAKRVGYYREYDLRRYRDSEARRAAAFASFRAAQAANPHRRKAAVMVGNAVRSGALVPQPCFICGDKAQAHHPDYSRPLDVVWLCISHHRQAHAIARSVDKRADLVLAEPEKGQT